MRTKPTIYQDQLVTTIGGGTGTYPVVAALRTLCNHLTCIVAVSDSGGSSARLRDEFGFPPVGDLRQSLTALANPTSQHLLQKLLLYRFNKGRELKGHNLGNLILTALQDMTGTTTQALETAAQLFQFHGRVIPITEDSVNLKVFYRDGTSIIGEHLLDEVDAPSKPIRKIALVPKPKTNPQALEILSQSDHLIIGPGDLFASLEAVLVAPKVSKIIQNSNAKITYIVNIMTRRSQTAGMSATDHVAEIEKVIKRSITNIVINNRSPKPEQLAPYQLVDEYPVLDDLGNDRRVIRAPLLTYTPTKQSASDVVPRSVLRHNSNQLQKVLRRILKNQ